MQSLASWMQLRSAATLCSTLAHCYNSAEALQLAACAGKPTGKVIEEYSDLYGFAAKAMSAKWVLQKPTGTKPVEAAG